jgi:glycosyltransferase involved in cell wall biosynthesis
MKGGVGDFTQELARSLAVLGYQIHIISDRRARPDNEERNWRTLREPVDLGFAQLHAQIGNWRWPMLWKLTDTVIRYELDLLNIQYQAAAYSMRSPAINLAPWRLSGVTKTVVTFHDLRVPYLFPKAGRLRRAAVNFMAQQSHGVIVTNEADYRAMTAVPLQSMARIPIGSNITAHKTNAARVLELRARLGIGPEHFLLGYFGFLNESKGADLLLEALSKQSDNTHLVFIGGQTGSSDPVNNELFHGQMKRLIQELGLANRVHWTGFVSDEEVSGYLKAADLMVIPYLDGVSLRRGTLMAILAHGRPLLTTQPLVPVPELAHRRHMYMVPAGKVDVLSEAIDLLKSDSSLRNKMGQQARQLAGSFSWDKIARRTAQFFTELLEG